MKHEKTPGSDQDNDACDTPSPLGSNVPRREGAAKLRGKAQFVDDLPQEGVWVAGTVRADVPNARLIGIRRDEAFDWDRVVVITAADIPGENVVPVVLRDQPSLAEDLIRYQGQPVALVAAPDQATLTQAINSITIDTLPLEPVFDIDEALDAKTLIYGEDNLFRCIEITKGDAQGAIQAAAIVIGGEYRTGAQEHAYLEPQGMQAERTGDGITIRGSMQCPYYLVNAVAGLLDLPKEKIRVIPHLTGGAFGGKDDFPTMLGGHVALLAWKARQPVRLVYQRGEDMRFTSKRHPARIRHQTGFTRDGRLVGMSVELVLDGGAYSTMSPLVLSRASIHATGPYQCENIHVVARAVATNHPPRGAFRGFGAPQTLFAVETHLDYCASKLGVDPLELRRKNLIRRGGTLATGQNVGDDASALDVLELAVKESDFVARREAWADDNRQADSKSGNSRLKRRGIGLSLFMHGTGLSGYEEIIFKSGVALRGNADGTITALSSQVEVGQGTLTILAQLAAEGLGVPVEWVRTGQPDTNENLDSGPMASRTATIIGGLLITAGKRFRADVERHHGSPLPDPNEFRSAVAELVSHGSLSEVREHYCPPPDMKWDEETHRGDAYPTYAWACCVVALEVDTLAGEIDLIDVTAVQDVGKVVNPMFAAGQVQGGVAQGLGWALMENVVWNDGVMVGANLTDYCIPTSMDLPPIHAVFLEHPQPRAPHGAKGLGELPMEGPAPAVVNALRNALDAQFTEVPVLPEIILAACEQREPGAVPVSAKTVPAKRKEPNAKPANMENSLQTGSDLVVRFNLNGRPVEVHAPPMHRLLDLLRETLGLTGTKNGCGDGSCGACAVLVDGHAVNSCLVPIVQIDGSAVRTVEDLADGESLNLLQKCFLECGGTQCGSCLPGILMTATAHLDEGGDTDAESLRAALAGNLCRCTGYVKIIESIQQAAALRKEPNAQHHH